MVKVLVADSLPENALEILTKAGVEVQIKTGLKEDELIKIIGEYDGIAVRSATKVTAKVIEAGKKLRLIGRAGVGVDNIDVKAATARGVIVMNTPLGNIQSAAEHALALLFALARKVPFADQEMKSGKWPKKEAVGTEFCEKALGVIGMGRIGRIVSRTMGTLGMQVLAHDPFLTPEAAAELNVKLVPLDDLLARSDFITVHTPLSDATRNLLNAAAFKKMKKSVRLVNCARGGIVNEADLAAALEAGTIAGAALDVFATEPLAPDSPLRKAPNMVLTPHLGASTHEAERKVAEDIAKQFAAFFTKGDIQNAVNLSVTLDPNAAIFANLSETLGRLAAQLVEGPVTELACQFNGKQVNEHEKTLAVFVLKGLLGEGSDEPVNLVNAPHLAERRGIRLSRQSSRESANFVNLVRVTARTPTGSVSVRGTLFDGTQPRIVGLWEFDIEFAPQPNVLIIRYKDMPGMIGLFGTVLGKAGVNIADMAVGRIERGQEAAAALCIDDPVPEAAMAILRKSPGYTFVRTVRL
jgi:D-3-phosphoglycerate dehydrogenase / 2-oxoglutarate reductase